MIVIAYNIFKEVLKRLPENRQTLLFSATLPKSIIAFSKAGLSDPVLGICHFLINVSVTFIINLALVLFNF